MLLDLVRVQEAGPDLIVAINLHPDTIADRGTVDWLVQAFADMPVSFEIIERGLRSDPAIADNLRRLSGAGLSIAIDDFGAGHSNFNLLADLPVSIVKFDRSLLLSAAEQRGRIVYRKLTGLCHELGYRVIAEGVETRAQADLVASCGVDLIQGWLHAPAMPLDEAIAFAERLNGADLVKSAPACWPMQPRN